VSGPTVPAAAAPAPVPAPMPAPAPMPGHAAMTPTPPVARPPADWTEEVSIIQPRNAAFWLFVGLLAIAGINFIDRQILFANASTTAWVVGIFLLALYAVPVFLLVRSLDLFEREPRSMLIGALLWGGIVATFLSGHVNDAWSEILTKIAGADFAREWGAALIGPGDEELFKFLGVVLLFLIARAEFDDVLDGFVYGAMVGLGFTLEEDMYYFFAHFVGQAGASDLGGLFDGFFARIIVGGPYSHVLLTGLTGMGLAYFVTRPDVPRQRRLLVAIGLYVAGVAAHFVWNSPLLNDVLGNDPDAVTWIMWAALKGLPFLILLAVIVRLAQRREMRWVREAVAPEVEAGYITPAELDSLEDLRRRRAARAAEKARTGPAGDRLLARLQKAQLALAVAATGGGDNRDAHLDANRSLVRTLRGQLDALPRVGAAAVVATPAAAAPGAAFAPSHRVPVEGLPAWQVPDGSTQSVGLNGGLELQLVQRVGDWAQVRATNGWTGWVDARRLLPR
jgi:RsiW-degrading membrane proteinase PrsW (M82 family)